MAYKSEHILQTNIRDERICSTDTTGTMLTLEHSTPPLTVWPNWEWADSTGKRTDLKIWTVAVDPAVPVCMSVASTPSTFGDTAQGNSVRGSAYCSPSLHATDYTYIQSSQMSVWKTELFSLCRPHLIVNFKKKFLSSPSHLTCWMEFDRGITHILHTFQSEMSQALWSRG